MQQEETVGMTICRVAGVEAYRAIQKVRGGMDIEFPKSPDFLTEDHWLVETVGMEAARKIAAEFFGGRIYIQMPPNNGEDERQRQIAKMANEGMGTRQIAIALGMSDRNVRRLKSGNPYLEPASEEGVAA